MKISYCRQHINGGQVNSANFSCAFINSFSKSSIAVKRSSADQKNNSSAKDDDPKVFPDEKHHYFLVEEEELMNSTGGRINS